MTLSVDFTDMTISREMILQLDDPHFTADNICIVTGAGSGIGRAVAIAASLNGLLSIGVDINSNALKETSQMARDLGGELSYFQADLTKDDDIESVVSKAAKMGQVRYLANIAGIQNVCPIEEFPMEKYDQMQRLMLRAPFYLSKLMIPHMKKNNDGGGVIGNMASIHAHITPPNKSAYCIAKFGLRGLTQAISAEGQGKIRSFSMSTGHVKTPLILNQIPDQARTRNVTPQQVIDEVMLGKARIKEMMTTAEVANLFMFAFSSHARYLIGGDLLFDGGTVLTYI